MATFTINYQLFMGCILALASATDLAKADKSDASAGSVRLANDCSSDQKYYYFIGTGVGNTKAIANQVALMDARKNALICIFGGVISYQSNTQGATESITNSANTSVSVSSEHIDWSAFDLIQAQDVQTDNSFSSTNQFRWSKKAINAVKAQRDILVKERRRSKDLAAVVTETQRISAEKDELLRRQQRELDELRRHQLDLLSNAAKNDQILAKLELKKKERQEKDEQWLNMVSKFGCGVTIADLKALLGRPKETLVYTTEEGRRYRPWLYFIYGNFALIAPVHDDLWVLQNGDVNGVLRNANRYQITHVSRFRGDGAQWWICKPST